MIILQFLSLILFLGLCPVLLGLPWTQWTVQPDSQKYAPSASLSSPICKPALAYAVGFFLQLALFHPLAFAVTLFHGSVRLLTVLYTVVLLLACVACAAYEARKGLFARLRPVRGWWRLAWYEWPVLAALLLLLGYMLYKAFVRDLKFLSYDDAVYVSWATNALEANEIGRIAVYTGEGGRLNLKRAIQTWLMIPAWLSSVSGFSVVVLCHTVLQAQLTVLAFAVYFDLAALLFEKRLNRLIFLMVLALFCVYSYYSHYSFPFRLLGPIYQGKAVLAVALTPLVWSVLIRQLPQPYSRRTGVLLCLLSVAATALTLWGTGTMGIIVGVPLFLSLFRSPRCWKNLWYLLWAGVVPALSAGLYLLVSKVLV